VPQEQLVDESGIADVELFETQHAGKRATYGASASLILCWNRLPSSVAEIVKEVRGVGLLNSIELNAPKKLALWALYEAFCRIHPAMFGPALLMRMFREKNILT
jgi:adenosylmethionine-8-amino-7-oxononanoate aminotransferase